MRAIASTTEHPAKTAGQRCTSRAMRTPARSARSSAQQAQAMCGTGACASAATSIILIQTGVSASVSLFVLLITIVSLLVVLISLSGLTGLVHSLVGLITGLVPDATMGD